MIHWTLSDLKGHIFTTPSSRYFFDFWLYQADGIENNFDYSDFVNPRVILEEIVGESENNGLLNKDHREYFHRQIGYFVKLDNCISKRISAEFNSLQQLIEKGDAFSAILSAKQLLKYFKSFEYLKSLLGVLSSMVVEINLTDNLKTKIRYHTRSAITEFIYAGFLAKELSELVNNVFGEIDNSHGDIYHTSFPHGISFENLKEANKDQKEAYNRVLVNYMNSLDVSARVGALYKYVDIMDRTYIFQIAIHGLTTSNTVLKIKDVTFIHCDCEEFLGSSTINQEHKLDLRGNYKVYAQIEVLGKNITALAKIARYKLISTLDIMRFYDTSKQTYQLGFEYKCFLDRKFYCNGHFEGQRAHLLALEGMEIDHHTDDGFAVLYNSDLVKNLALDNDENDSSQIYSSLNYYLRATEAANYTQQILFSWIALESLMTYNKHVLYSSSIRKKEVKKEDIILQYIPYIAIYEKFTADVFALYFRLYGLYHSYSGLNNIKRYRGLELTESEATEAALDIEGPREITLAETIEYLKSIRNFTVKELVKDLISDVIDIYQSSQKADNVIQQSIIRSIDGLHTIYRY